MQYLCQSAGHGSDLNELDRGRDNSYWHVCYLIGQGIYVEDWASFEDT